MCVGDFSGGPPRVQHRGHHRLLESGGAPCTGRQLLGDLGEGPARARRLNADEARLNDHYLSGDTAGGDVVDSLTDALVHLSGERPAARAGCSVVWWSDRCEGAHVFWSMARVLRD